ncbi:MAG: hypothetical protein H8D55_02925 [Deltaproteobacteria bacterium]|nr:hypothetical protein [Deltaproteobacteria bacterium]
MKKLFLALSVLAMLIFAAVPSQALVSMPDAAPGQDVLLPFFLTEITSGESTLLVIQEVGGAAQYLKFYVNDIDSAVAYNYQESMSAYDVAFWNVRDDFIANASTVGKNMLLYDLSGDGVNDHYAGYIDIQNWTSLTSSVRTTDNNSLVAFMYQIDLASGIASAAIIPAIEYEGNTQPQSDNMVNTTTRLELFDARALAAAKARIAGVTPDATPTSFSMYPRYYVHDSNASNYLFSWRSTTTEYTYDWVFYDEAEAPLSGPVILTHELDIINVDDIVPAGHQSSTASWAGWINMVGTTGTNYTNTDQWVMYNYQKVVGGTVGTNWNVLYGVHRQVGTDS